jgi:hypothetical protein
MGKEQKPKPDNKEDWKNKRDDIYFWNSLEHLQNNYVKYISPQEVYEIAEDIKREGRFKIREGISAEENQAGFFNLVEREIIKRIKGNVS